MDARFSGKTAIVTGAGSGIGRAVALRLAREGARVVVTDVRADRVDDTLTEIKGVGRSEAVGVIGNVAVQTDVEAIVAAAGDRVDVLANVAGIMDGFLPVGELDDATWELVLDVNLTAPMRLTRGVLGAMVRAGAGAIVNVASEAALRGGAAGTAYTVAKHGVIGLTRSTAVLYGPSGIRCNAVIPGAVATNIEATPRSELAMSVLGPHLGMIPSAATAEDLASSICWLASADARNVNGALLASDGGWSAA
jgi:NAD(P)-dependent dehydrogenase (short-subunit alcohol dehydrogenase family)